MNFNKYIKQVDHNTGGLDLDKLIIDFPEIGDKKRRIELKRVFREKAKVSQTASNRLFSGAKCSYTFLISFLYISFEQNRVSEKMKEQYEKGFKAGEESVQIIEKAESKTLADHANNQIREREINLAYKQGFDDGKGSVETVDYLNDDQVDAIREIVRAFKIANATQKLKEIL